MRRVLILGSTGSIGVQALDVIRAADDMAVAGLACGRQADLMAAQAAEHGVAHTVCAAGGGTMEAGEDLAELIEATAPDIVLNALVGAAGLRPTLAALERGIPVALANKETLVAGGEVVAAVRARTGAMLVPVDSEHSALFQLVEGVPEERIRALVLTASGGPFRDWPVEKMALATPEQAKAHPNWDMGERISIDSATMFNKALEVIEAQALFDVAPETIEVVVHPQSIVHSMVGFRDGSIMAHLGPSDMRGPIGFALNWPARERLPLDRLDFATLGRLDFLPSDPVRFPALRLAREVLRMGGLSGAVFNAAKEAALDAFLVRAIGFLDMAVLVEHVLEKAGPAAAAEAPGYGLDAVTAADAEARRLAGLWVEAFSGN